MQSLQGMSGPAFDIAYLKAQVLGHNPLAGIQSDFLASDTDLTADLVHVALISPNRLHRNASLRAACLGSDRLSYRLNTSPNKPHATAFQTLPTASLLSLRLSARLQPTCASST